ncbi:MAG: hypothetical protein ACKVS9_10390 [Phycisphaerae bacterium]
MIRLEMEFGRIDIRTRRTLLSLAVSAGLASVALAQETTQPGNLPPASSSPAVATPPPATPANKPEPAPVASTVETGFVRVTAREVNIRSRADVNSVPVMRIKRGSVLKTVGKEYGWFKILPPEGTYYYAAARYVERSGETAGTVRVSTTPLNIRVASQVMTVSPDTADVVGQAANGTPVEILGQDGEWLRIKPPVGIYCFINEDFVERVTDAQGAIVITDEPPTAAVATSRPTGEALVPTTAPALTAADMTGTFGQQLARIEKDIDTQAGKPILSQSWDAILENLKRIAAQREEPQVAAAADAWIPRVERQRAAQATQREREPVAARASAEKAQADAELERLRQAREALDGRTDFEALGLLRPTFALPTGEYGLRYKLVDPVSQKTRAYVEFPTALGLDLSKINGKYVGIFGDRLSGDEFKDIGAPMYRVQKVTVLTAPAESAADRRERP